MESHAILNVGILDWWSTDLYTNAYNNNTILQQQKMKRKSISSSCFKESNKNKK